MSWKTMSLVFLPTMSILVCSVYPAIAALANNLSLISQDMQGTTKPSPLKGYK